MALCARAALLLGVLQVLALLGAAQDPTDAQGSASGNHSVLTSNINITAVSLYGV
uniref:Transmembrane protein 123 n=1 Tax=Mus musculus TaxID=10090 RepID=D6REH0_MOUSE